MFIKYVLTPLRMDKKKRYRKTFVQTWRPRNYPVTIRYFCIIFLSIQWKVTHRRRQKRRREQENTFNTRKIAEIGKIVVCVSCVLWSFISFEKLKYKRAHEGLAPVSACTSARWSRVSQTKSLIEIKMSSGSSSKYRVGGFSLCSALPPPSAPIWS